jgi:flagellar basal body-associated protein FliL
MKKLRSRLGLLIGLAVFILGSGVAVWFFVLSPARAAEAPSPEATATIYSLEPFITNLADIGSRRILRVTMELLVAKGTDAKELDRQKPQLRSEILALLRSRYMADLEGERGMSRLASDIAERANTVLGQPAVLRVYFTDFIIQ